MNIPLYKENALTVSFEWFERFVPATELHTAWALPLEVKQQLYPELFLFGPEATRIVEVGEKLADLTDLPIDNPFRKSFYSLRELGFWGSDASSNNKSISHNSIRLLNNLRFLVDIYADYDYYLESFGILVAVIGDDVIEPINRVEKLRESLESTTLEAIKGTTKN